MATAEKPSLKPCKLTWCAAALFSAMLHQAHAAGGQLINDPGHKANAEKAATAYITNILKDPDSARFHFPLSPKAGVLNAMTITRSGYFLCGEVNAKNSYGGYTGFKTFMVIFSDASLNAVAEGTIESPASGVVSDWCANIYQ
jgi:hypothetical protein